MRRRERCPAGSASMLQAAAVLAFESLRIVAPAAPGGGWDQTARALQQAIRAEGLAEVVQVENVAGAAGTIGLARFVKGARRDEPALLVTGLVMQSAIVAHQTAVTLRRVTPIARLTGEYEVIVVPAASPHRSLDDLVAALRRDPGAVSWAGGSAGGTDELLVALLAKSAGVPPARVNYVAFSGGGEALAGLLGGQVSAGVAGYSEFAPHVAAGTLRALAVSAPARLPGAAIPTLTERGYDVVLSNWRGVMGPSKAAPELRARLEAMIARVHASPAWRASLTRFGWTDLYLASSAFERFLDDEQARIEAILLSLRSDSDAAPLSRSGAAVFPALIGIGLLLVVGALTVERVRRKPQSAAATPTRGDVRAVGLLSAGAAASIVLLEPAGFLISSALLFCCTASAFGSRRWGRDLAAGGAFALLLDAIFRRGLSLSLPEGVFKGIL